MNQPVRLSRLAATASSGFEEPFEMLEACHDRVQRMLRLLERLRAHVAGHGDDEQARQAARDIMRYFDVAAPQHHLDEERHVFPPLLAAGDAQVQAVVRRLQQDHRQMEIAWARAREVLDTLARGARPALDQAATCTLVDFAALYAGHIEAEEGIAYPAARQRLQAADLQAMSRDMMERRGVR